MMAMSPVATRDEEMVAEKGRRLGVSTESPGHEGPPSDELHFALLGVGPSYPSPQRSEQEKTHKLEQSGSGETQGSAGANQWILVGSRKDDTYSASHCMCPSPVLLRWALGTKEQIWILSWSRDRSQLRCHLLWTERHGAHVVFPDMTFIPLQSVPKAPKASRPGPVTCVLPCPLLLGPNTRRSQGQGMCQTVVW